MKASEADADASNGQRSQAHECAPRIARVTTLFDIVCEHARANPDGLAFAFLDRNLQTTQQLSFGHLCGRARAIAAGLRRRHRPGDRVGLMYGPGLAFVEAILGCFAAGLVAVPLQPLHNRRVLQRLFSMLGDAGTLTVLTDALTGEQIARFAPELAASRDGYSCIDTGQFRTGDEAGFREHAAADADLAFLQYTSGSTGMPKGVMVSHANVLANQGSIRAAFGHSGRTRVVSWLPAYHDMGLIGGIFQPLYLGIPAALMAPMTFLASPATWLRAISMFGATTSGGPDFAYELCAGRVSNAELHDIDLDVWQVAFNGAEPVNPRVLRRFAERFAVRGFHSKAFYPCYGMAETTLLLTGGDPELPPTNLQVNGEALAAGVVREADTEGTAIVGCGWPRDNNEVRIVDPATCAELPDGRVGEIWCRGASVAQGYWGNADATRQTFEARTANDDGPFLRTGDLGFRHNGELFIAGRLKDVIIVRGQNHYPTDIERAVAGSGEGYCANGLAAFAVEEANELRLVVLAEVERHLVRRVTTEVAAARLASARRCVFEAHGLFLNELLLLKPGSLPRTSSGKVRRSYARTSFLQEGHGELEIILPLKQTTI